jgi:hypothetical protein
MSPVLKVSFFALLLAVTVNGQELRVTATNVLNFLFVDNFQHTPLPNANNWMTPDRVPIEDNARLIAIRGNNIDGGCSGLMVASYDSQHELVSDRTWKCSSSPANGWQFLGFDDSSWEEATQIAANGEIVTGCSWFIIQDMPVNTHWIWTEAWFGGDNIVSCRGYTKVCEKMPCFNGGTCNMNSLAICSCPVRWGGTYCELPINECQSNPCQNNGECELDDSGYNCKCALGFTGVHCETDTTDCASQPCQNGGTCNFDIDGGYTCSCVDGYSGLDCETNIDECDSNPCLNDATCHDGVNSITCECVPGFTGMFCQNDINECLSNPCLSASTCEDLVNGYQCNCHSGYTGALCETPIGACESDPCQNGGTCTLGGPGGSIQCICTPGWSGPLCNSNENECLSDPCRNDGTCIDGDGEYTCFCKDEFYGPNCESVIPNCGSILKQSGFPAINRFEILCELNIIEHPEYLSTPCSQLIRGINYYNDAETILARGGNFGCYPTRFPDEINNACVPGYNQQAIMSSCMSCVSMGVCIDFPDAMKSSPKN